MSIPDEPMRQYFTLLTDLPLAEVDRLLGPGVNPRDAKEVLGKAIVAQYHGAEAADGPPPSSAGGQGPTRHFLQQRRGGDADVRRRHHRDRTLPAAPGTTATCRSAMACPTSGVQFSMK